MIGIRSRLILVYRKRRSLFSGAPKRSSAATRGTRGSLAALHRLLRQIAVAEVTQFRVPTENQVFQLDSEGKGEFVLEIVDSGKPYIAVIAAADNPLDFVELTGAGVDMAF